METNLSHGKTTSDAHAREMDFGAAMRAALGGDAVIYRQLLTALRPLLEAYATRLLSRMGIRDAGTVDDVVQEILIAVHEKRHTFDTTRPFLPWLFAIARYRTIDFLRRQRKHRGVGLQDLESVLAAPVFEEPLAAADLETMMTTLSPVVGNLLRMTKLEGLSVAETASISQMTPVAVKVAVHRGLKTLAERFRKGRND